MYGASFSPAAPFSSRCSMLISARCLDARCVLLPSPITLFAVQHKRFKTIPVLAEWRAIASAIALACIFFALRLSKSAFTGNVPTIPAYPRAA